MDNLKPKNVRAYSIDEIKKILKDTSKDTVKTRKNLSKDAIVNMIRTSNHKALLLENEYM